MAIEPKRSSVGISSMIMGQNTTKKSSSRNKVVSVSVVARPASIPSRLR